MARTPQLGTNDAPAPPGFLSHGTSLPTARNQGPQSPRADSAPAVGVPSSIQSSPPEHQIRLVMGRRGGEMRHTMMAKELGVHPRTIRRLYYRGGLPGAKEHGERILMVPTHLFRLAQTYGLRGVERMARSGLLSA